MEVSENLPQTHSALLPQQVDALVVISAGMLWLLGKVLVDGRCKALGCVFREEIDCNDQKDNVR